VRIPATITRLIVWEGGVDATRMLTDMCVDRWVAAASTWRRPPRLGAVCINKISHAPCEVIS
jgi:hypothetical protein